MPTMTRATTLLLGSAAVCLWASGCGEPSSPQPGEKQTPRPSNSIVATSSVVSPALAQLLLAAAPTDQLFVVVQYDDQVVTGTAVSQQVMALGAGARTLQQLPFVGVLGTPSQIQAVAGIPGVTWVSPNGRLLYMSAGSSRFIRSSLLAMLDRSVPTIKADQARAQYGVSGRGVGVAI